MYEGKPGSIPTYIQWRGVAANHGGISTIGSEEKVGIWEGAVAAGLCTEYMRHTCTCFYEAQQLTSIGIHHSNGNLSIGIRNLTAPSRYSVHNV